MAEESNAIIQRLSLFQEQRNLTDAMRVINDETHDGGLPESALHWLAVFRHRLNRAVLALQQIDDEQQIFQCLYWLVELANRETSDHFLELREHASQQFAAAVVDSLEKQMFRTAGGEDDDGGATECSICLKEFVDGELVTVMPCPSQGHKFHPDCITNWLVIRNTCPLCRHQLPTAEDVMRIYDQLSEA